MGVINVTPDSFSDGGVSEAPPPPAAHGRRLLAEGADILDVGGESTRPGAAPVPAADELRRGPPVVEGLAGARLSIDTMKLAGAEGGPDPRAGHAHHRPPLPPQPAPAGPGARRGGRRRPVA